MCVSHLRFDKSSESTMKHSSARSTIMSTFDTSFLGFDE